MIELIHQYYLSIKRSPLFESKLFSKLLSLIAFSIFFINLITIGFYLDVIFFKINPKQSPFDTFYRVFLFLWVVDIIVKFLYKPNKYIDIQPYITLPIKQNKIFLLLFIKELFSGWNFIWVAILTPFFFKNFFVSAGLISTCLLIGFVYCISLTISIIIRFINIATIQKSFLYFLSPLFLTVIISYFGYEIAVSPHLFIDIKYLFLNYKLLITIIISASFLCLYFFFLKFTKQEIYSLFSTKNKSISFIEFNWFDPLGINGEIIKLCFKEIIRSQLIRSFFLSFIILIYYLFLVNLNEVSYFLRVFLAVAPTIMLGNILGEFSFSSESTFFDRIMVAPKTPAYLLLIHKYIICVVFSAFFTIVSIVFYFNSVSPLFWIAIFFFEIGVLLFFIFQNAVYNKQRFDIMGPLRNISSLNLTSLFATGLIIPMIGLVLLISWLTTEEIANYFMLGIGILFTFTSPLWIKNIYKRFLSRKFENIDGFRKI